MKLSLIEIHRYQNQLVACFSEVDRLTKMCGEAAGKRYNSELVDSAEPYARLSQSWKKQLSEEYFAFEKMKGDVNESR